MIPDWRRRLRHTSCRFKARCLFLRHPSRGRAAFVIIYASESEWLAAAGSMLSWLHAVPSAAPAGLGCLACTRNHLQDRSKHHSLRQRHQMRPQSPSLGVHMGLRRPGYSIVVPGSTAHSHHMAEAFQRNGCTTSHEHELSQVSSPRYLEHGCGTPALSQMDCYPNQSTTIVLPSRTQPRLHIVFSPTVLCPDAVVNIYRRNARR